jgi:membrane protein
MWPRLRGSPWIDLPLRTVRAWSSDGIPRLAAALSYYTVFSLAPLLIIVLGILGLVIDRATLQRHLLLEVTQLIGPGPASAIGSILDHASGPGRGILATIIGIGTLVFGATGVFVELKGSLNLVWRVPPRTGGGVMGLVRQYFAPLTMILGIGFLLLVSLMLSAVLTAVATYIGSSLPALVAALRIADQVLAFAMVTGLFALIYKVLPDTHLRWSDVWLGAGVAGLLFTIGRFLIGLYLGRASIGSTYGAAGSLVVILAWVYYSAQILLVGAEFTRVHSESKGSRPARAEVPPPGAECRRVPA